MSTKRVLLHYTADTIAEPIIYTICHQFNLTMNIIQADISEDKGWIIVEFDGQEEDIEAGIVWAISKGIRAEPVANT